MVYINDRTTGLPLIQIRLKVEAAGTKQAGKKVYRVYPRNYIEAPTNSIMYAIYGLK